MSEPTRPPRDPDTLVGWLIGPLFLVAAAWFLLRPAPEVPLAERVAVERVDITPTPMRTVMNMSFGVLSSTRKK